MKKNTIEGLLLNEMQFIHKYLIKMGASKEDTEDIIQETLIKAIEYIDVIDENKLQSWLFKVSINKYYDLLRKGKSKELQLNQDIYVNLQSNVLVENQVLSAEVNVNIQKALNYLKESYKNLIVLKYFLDLSYKEISNVLDISESQVKTYLYRARLKFKEVWEEIENGKK